ncbi:MAG: hypothetical protein SGI92_04055 [Bryobacteraceae bacterium]|nr:hypothetical protein [Bryobacteraceae bacterium]
MGRQRRPVPFLPRLYGATKQPHRPGRWQTQIQEDVRAIAVALDRTIPSLATVPETRSSSSSTPPAVNNGDAPSEERWRTRPGQQRPHHRHARDSFLPWTPTENILFGFRNFLAKITPSRALACVVPTGESFASKPTVDAASLRGTRLAPGEAISLFGDGLGPEAALTGTPTNGMLPTSLGDTRPSALSAKRQINALLQKATNRSKQPGSSLTRRGAGPQACGGRPRPPVTSSYAAAQERIIR